MSVSPSITNRLREFLALTKPRVNALIIFCAVIGMFLAVDGMVPWRPLVYGTLGIALLAGAAAAINHLLEQEIDRRMARTRARPLAIGQLTSGQALGFALTLGLLGFAILMVLVNPLTAWLTLATFVGYAVIYTVLLKPATPQNIVIGGASGAMPPVLGWAAVTNEVEAGALILFLIIFVWTPPHFWALALYRRQEYAKAGLPMLPVTHGEFFTRLHMLLYTFLLVAVTLLPVATRMSHAVYFVLMLLLNAGFLVHAFSIYRHYSDQKAQAMFKYSITYLAGIFAALLVDHYYVVRLG